MTARIVTAKRHPHDQVPPPRADRGPGRGYATRSAAVLWAGPTLGLTMLGAATLLGLAGRLAQRLATDMADPQQLAAAAAALAALALGLWLARRLRLERHLRLAAAAPLVALLSLGTEGLQRRCAALVDGLPGSIAAALLAALVAGTALGLLLGFAGQGLIRRAR